MDSQSDEGINQSLDRRRRLQNIMDQGQEFERDMSKYNLVHALETICDYIVQSDGIMTEGDVQDRAGHTTEVVMDTHVLRMNHELISKVLQKNLEFNAVLYQNAIISAVTPSGTRPDWNILADIACKITRTVNVHSTMLGAVETELKTPVVKQRQQRRKADLAVEQRPEIVNKITRQDDGAEKVNVIHQQLAQIFKENNRRAVPFYKLIVDPTNFMNSVENAFQLAFLARDGIIGIENGQDGNPEVRLIQKKAEQKLEMDTSQWICSLDMNLCNIMAKLYKIKEPLLKCEQRNAAREEDEAMNSGSENEYYY